MGPARFHCATLLYFLVCVHHYQNLNEHYSAPAHMSFFCNVIGKAKSEMEWGYLEMVYLVSIRD